VRWSTRPAYAWMVLAGPAVLLAWLPVFDRRGIAAH
jgi:hypothetical protein